METCGASALDSPASELTVMDVYDIAAALGQEFERIIDRFGCESLVGVVHKVVRVLELLEALVSRGAAGQEAEELRRELDRLRQERSDRCKQERRHQKELELVEDVWRGEVQDLLSQISQLQAENKRLSVSLPLTESPDPEEEAQKQEGMSENERQMMMKLKDLVDKQRDEIRAKDHELTLRNEDVEALQMQQHRVIRINQDLRRRTGVMEAQGKALIQHKAELEAAAQAQQQELGALQQEVARLRKELQGWEIERELTNILETSLVTSGMPVATSPETTSAAAAPPTCTVKPSSVWVECAADPDFLGNCSPSPSSSNGENTTKGYNDKDKTDLFLKGSTEGESEEEPDKPCFTVPELRDVLQERNELKAQVFVLQEELAYYKSDFEDDITSVLCPPSPPPFSSSADRPESGIRCLIFTTIMPMVAAGLIADDPTLLPIRRLLSSA